MSHHQPRLRLTTVSVLHFPETGAVTAVVPQYLYRMIYGKTRPEPLTWLDNLKLMNQEELCFWLGQRQEENTALTSLMDEYVIFTRY